MSTAARLRAAVLVATAIVLVAVVWHGGLIFASGGLSEDRPPDYWFQFFVLSLVLATPWFPAVGLLWAAWRAGAAGSSSGMDRPARLLAAATATLPESRRDWGGAMIAELAQVVDRPVRWRFAVGCERVAADTSLILAGDGVPLDSVGENIRNFAFLLVLLPLFWMPFGVLGAALGRAGRARLSRPR